MSQYNHALPKREKELSILNEQTQKQWGTSQLVFVAVLLTLVLAMIVGFILWQINEFTLELGLNGPDEITVEYGTPYEDPGALHQRL